MQTIHVFEQQMLEAEFIFINSSPAGGGVFHRQPPLRGSPDYKMAETPQDRWQSSDDPAGESTRQIPSVVIVHTKLNLRLKLFVAIFLFKQHFSPGN
jgi:hypothetical protein